MGLEIRAGVHTGEVELMGQDVRGIAVHIGARVCAMAAPQEVLVSSTVKDLVVGSGLTFEDRGEHELKGVPDRWHLYRSERTGFKWLARYDREGEAGLVDLGARPRSIPVAVPEERISAIVGLRQLRMTGAQIAQALSMPTSTIGTVLRRLGIGKLKNLEPEVPPNRYERRLWGCSYCSSTPTRRR